LKKKKISKSKEVKTEVLKPKKKNLEDRAFDLLGKKMEQQNK